MSARVDRTLTNRVERRAHTNVVPHLIRILDFERPGHPGSRHSLDRIDEVSVGRGDADLVTRNERSLTIVCADPRMSQQHARFVRLDRRWAIADLGSRNGSFVDGVKLDRGVVEDGAVIVLGRTAWMLRSCELEEPPDVTATALTSPIGSIRTFSTRFATSLANLARVALADQHIVLHGETGTGKELLARGAHAASGRNGPFVAVNCGALPETLVESELFGYRKGAFSGASEDRIGLVRAADGGTLFLDEIADLPRGTQAALLRVLQEREVTPIGSTKPIAVDLRVVAASHRDLEEEVRAGRFREDLLARLAGYVVEIPSLHARREDLGILIATFLVRFGPGRAWRLAPEAGEALLRYAWPRNVRELEQAIGSAIALSRDGSIELEHLGPAIQRAAEQRPDDEPADADDLSPSEIRRRDELRDLLAKHRGNIAAVARELGVARTQIHRWLERYKIDIAAFRG